MPHLVVCWISVGRNGWGVQNFGTFEYPHLNDSMRTGFLGTTPIHGQFFTEFQSHRWFQFGVHFKTIHTRPLWNRTAWHWRVTWIRRRSCCACCPCRHKPTCHVCECSALFPAFWWSCCAISRWNIVEHRREVTWFDICIMNESSLFVYLQLYIVLHVCLTYILHYVLSCTNIIIASILSIPSGAHPCSLGSFHTFNIIGALQHDVTTRFSQISAI